MHYFLDYTIVDQKKDMWFVGPIYDKNQNSIDNVFLFSTGSSLNEKEIGAPFTLILDEKQSSMKNKTRIDKISTTTVGAGIVFLASPAVIEVFTKLQLNNVEFFNITIKSKDFELSDYKIINITDKIDCADLTKSDLVIKREEIRSMKSLVLDESKIPEGKKIFLLGRMDTGVVIVHEDLRRSVEEAGLTGFRFVELENARGFY